MTELEKAGMQYSHNHTDEDESGVSIRLREAFIAGAEWQFKQSPWISVEELLPHDLHKNVLLKIEKCGVLIGLGLNIQRKNLNITHWMEIPE